MKYKLDNELQILASQKISSSLRVMALMNLISTMIKCKSDAKVNVKKCDIPCYEGALRLAYVIEPKEVQEKLPCLVFFHGGGFLLKPGLAHYELAKEYAAKLPCKVITVDYRVAPKYPFPYPQEDCFATYKWVLDHADELNIDTDKIVVNGDSAGGTLAAAVALMARDRGIKIPRGAMLSYPATDRRMQTESVKKYADAPVWDAALSEMMWKIFLGEKEHEHIEYASLMEASSLADFPKTYLEVAEFDTLHDEGILFCERLRTEGCEVELHDTKGTCHGYENMMESKIMRKCMENRIAWLKELVKEYENIRN